MHATSIRMGAAHGRGLKLPLPPTTHGTKQAPQTTSQHSQSYGNDGKTLSQCRSQAADNGATVVPGAVQPALLPFSTTRVPLRDTVGEAVKRWFNECHQDALRGDVKAQAVLGQMYTEGYGCEKNPVAAQEWIEMSVARGYRMQGVYCEL